LAVGSVLGYLARQSIARKKAGSLEAELQKKIEQAKAQSQSIIKQAEEKAQNLLGILKEKEEKRREELSKIEQFLHQKEENLDRKSQSLEQEQKSFQATVEDLRGVKKRIEALKQEAEENLERVGGLSKEKAKDELLGNVEKEYQTEILGRMRKLEADGMEKLEKRAKEILALTIQRYALSQAQEITSTTVSLPSDDIKGRIIGKEGRNIRAIEKLTGVEIIVDDTPDIVVISGFSPIRREIAKVALERLIKDKRIQPARIEKEVERAESEILLQIKEAGEAAVYETGVVGLDPKLVQLLGRLRFRTSYGQNVLLHSVEVSYLAAGLAAEVGANVRVARKAGLLHDIGKAVDHQIQGSHVDIGIKILEKFGVEEEVIVAMKSHHEEYPAESKEAVLVQAADQISGARPGARKDTLENYLKRLEELEAIATSFAGVKKAYAIQAGRDLRVFVGPEEINDLEAQKLAKSIAERIQEELRYPGEIKVTVIRETRVIEYAR